MFIDQIGKVYGQYMQELNLTRALRTCMMKKNKRATELSFHICAHCLSNNTTEKQ